MSPARPNGQGPGSGAAGRGKPFDLEAAAAAEMLRDPFPFTYHGKDYSIPAQQLWPVEALEAFTEGELGKACRELIGDDAYLQLKLDGMKVGHLNALMTAVAEHSGMTLPNSSPPSAPASTPP